MLAGEKLLDKDYGFKTQLTAYYNHSPEKQLLPSNLHFRESVYCSLGLAPPSTGPHLPLLGHEGQSAGPIEHRGIDDGESEVAIRMSYLTDTKEEKRAKMGQSSCSLRPAAACRQAPRGHQLRSGLIWDISPLFQSEWPFLWLPTHTLWRRHQHPGPAPRHAMCTSTPMCLLI